MVLNRALEGWFVCQRCGMSSWSGEESRSCEYDLVSSPLDRIERIWTELLDPDAVCHPAGEDSLRAGATPWISTGISASSWLSSWERRSITICWDGACSAIKSKYFLWRLAHVHESLLTRQLYLNLNRPVSARRRQLRSPRAHRPIATYCWKTIRLRMPYSSHPFIHVP